MNNPYELSNFKALTKLLDFFNGNKSQMAQVAKVSRNTVGMWFRVGRIGRPSAVRLGKNKSIPFTKEQLRDDIKIWDHYKN